MGIGKIPKVGKGIKGSQAKKVTKQIHKILGKTHKNLKPVPKKVDKPKPPIESFIFVFEAADQALDLLYQLETFVDIFIRFHLCAYLEDKTLVYETTKTIIDILTAKVKLSGKLLGKLQISLGILDPFKDFIEDILKPINFFMDFFGPLYGITDHFLTFLDIIFDFRLDWLKLPRLRYKKAL